MIEVQFRISGAVTMYRCRAHGQQSLIVDDYGNAVPLHWAGLAVSVHNGE